jgi:hypothetical protein
MRKIICDICRKEVNGLQLQDLICFNMKKHGITLIEKHFDCGPEVRCVECLKRIKHRRIIPVDIYGGASELSRCSIFFNYCSFKCCKEDENYLEDVWEHLQKHPPNEYEYLDFKRWDGKVLKMRLYHNKKRKESKKRKRQDKDN